MYLVKSKSMKRKLIETERSCKMIRVTDSCNCVLDRNDFNIELDKEYTVRELIKRGCGNGSIRTKWAN